MTELLTAAQMRAIEAAAIASGQVTGPELMERAGRGVVEAVFAEWNVKEGTLRAVVLCGPGNNGGDGFVVARLLHHKGWQVEVFLFGTADAMPPSARANHDTWLQLGKIRSIDEFDPKAYTPDSSDKAGSVYIFDAMFGTGLSRPITGKLAQLMDQVAAMGLGARPAVIAIDLPSGICSDSGRSLGSAMPAEQVVTFHRAKLGHYLAEGAERSSILSVQDIGIQRPARRFDQVRLTGGDRALYCGLLGKGGSGHKAGERHKFSYGHALILSGPPGHGGAARMTARGALRIGAGLVTVACPPEALAENAARLDAIMLKTVSGGAGLAEILADTRINALCLGPGLGLDARAAELVRVALTTRRQDPAPNPTSRGLSLTLDADALTLISGDPTLFALLHKDCVLTPHGGEFARLFPDIAAKLNAPATKGPAYSKVDATREAAARAGCVVLFKGPDTVIASPDGTCALNAAAYDRAAPWLATAGAGDVLAGFITGLLARGFAPQIAAETAAWLHVESALSFGPGLIAEDLPEELPKVFRAMGL